MHRYLVNDLYKFESVVARSKQGIWAYKNVLIHKGISLSVGIFGIL